jgi:hypothetical protein
VPFEEYTAFISAESVGSYWNKNKNKYKYEKIS